MEDVVLRKESKFMSNRIVAFFLFSWVKDTNLLTQLSKRPFKRALPLTHLRSLFRTWVVSACWSARESAYWISLFCGFLIAWSYLCRGSVTMSSGSKSDRSLSLFCWRSSFLWDLSRFRLHPFFKDNLSLNLILNLLLGFPSLLWLSLFQLLSLLRFLSSQFIHRLFEPILKSSLSAERLELFAFLLTSPLSLFISLSRLLLPFFWFNPLTHSHPIMFLSWLGFFQSFY